MELAGGSADGAGRNRMIMLERLKQPISLKRPTLLRPSRESAPRATRHAPGKGVVGLDIQPGQVVAVRARVDGRIRVEQAAGLPLPPDIVREGEVADVEGLAAALSELFGREKLPKRIRIGVANQRIVLRRIELPPIGDAKELANAVRFRAQEEIPMPLDSVVLDFQALGITDTPNGPRQQVVLVAARRDMVERLLQAVRAAGLRPEGVDLSAFAMIRALRPAHAPPDERVLYLCVGGLTNLAIAEGRTCLFTRVIGGGLEAMVAEIAERCSLPVPEARALLESADLNRGDEAADPPEALAPAAAVDEHEEIAQLVLGESLRRLAGEVRNSLDFHQGQETGGEVVRAVLCGPAVDIPGFHRALSAEIGLPVTAGAVDLVSPSAAGGVPPSRLTIAAGLATEEGPA